MENSESTIEEAEKLNKATGFGPKSLFFLICVAAIYIAINGAYWAIGSGLIPEQYRLPISLTYFLVDAFAKGSAAALALLLVFHIGSSSKRIVGALSATLSDHRDSLKRNQTPIVVDEAAVGMFRDLIDADAKLYAQQVEELRMEKDGLNQEIVQLQSDVNTANERLEQAHLDIAKYEKVAREIAEEAAGLHGTTEKIAGARQRISELIGTMQKEDA